MTESPPKLKATPSFLASRPTHFPVTPGTVKLFSRPSHAFTSLRTQAASTLSESRSVTSSLSPKPSSALLGTSTPVVSQPLPNQGHEARSLRTDAILGGMAATVTAIILVGAYFCIRRRRRRLALRSDNGREAGVPIEGQNRQRSRGQRILSHVTPPWRAGSQRKSRRKRRYRIRDDASANSAEHDNDEGFASLVLPAPELPNPDADARSINTNVPRLELTAQRNIVELPRSSNHILQLSIPPGMGMEVVRARSSNDDGERGLSEPQLLRLIVREIRGRDDVEERPPSYHSS